MTPRKWREKNKLTQKGVADLLGVRQGHISMIEAGDRSPSIELAQRYHKVSKGAVTLHDFGAKK